MDVQKPIPLHHRKIPVSKRGKGDGKKKGVKVVYISSPMMVETCASSFRSLVQELTGWHADESWLMAAEAAAAAPAAEPVKNVSPPTSPVYANNDGGHMLEMDDPCLESPISYFDSMFKPFDNDEFGSLVDDDVRFSRMFSSSFFY